MPKQKASKHNKLQRHAWRVLLGPRYSVYSVSSVQGKATLLKTAAQATSHSNYAIYCLKKRGYPLKKQGTGNNIFRLAWGHSQGGLRAKKLPPGNLILLLLPFPLPLLLLILLLLLSFVLLCPQDVSGDK